MSVKALTVVESGVKAIQTVEKRIVGRVIRTVERAADDHFWLDDDGNLLPGDDNPLKTASARRLNAARAMLKDKRSARIGLDIGVRLLEAQRKVEAAAAASGPTNLNIGAINIVQARQYETIDVTPEVKT